MDALATLWANARAAHLLAVRRMVPIEVGDTHEKGYDANQDGFVMYTQKSRNIGTFFIPCNTHEEDRSILGRTAEHDGAGSVNPGQHFATWPNHAEHIH